MSDLYPLLLRPQFHERIWGTRDLAPIYADVPGKDPIGEVWLTGDDCQARNGPLAGISLGELCRRYGRELVGDSARETHRFPLLIKFLFPREKLSVQVHPDDETARRLGLPNGKTECWYVLKAEADAEIGLGLKPGTSREQFAQAIREVRAEQLLNWVKIHAGEMIYVDAGTVHTIGPGCVLVETQQNSDTTYRLYDYGRPRELHIEQGLTALKERTAAGKIAPRGNDDLATLVTSRCFIVERHRLSNSQQNRERRLGGKRALSLRSAEVLVALDGSGVVEARGSQPVTFGRGEAVVIPASVDDFQVHAQWELEMLTMALPQQEAEPAGSAAQVQVRARS